MAKEKVVNMMKKVEELREIYGRSLPDASEAGIVKRLIMDSPKLNYIMGGGLPLGRFLEFYGSESSGKSVLSSYIGSQIQNRIDNEQKIVLYVDTEYSFDSKFATNVGLNCDTNKGKFILVQPIDGEEAFTIMEDLIKTGEIGLVVYDSTSATPTRAAMTDDFGKRSFGGAGLLFSEGIKKITPYVSRHNTSVIFLTQMRAKIGFQSYGPPDVPSGGGYSVRFAASWRAKFTRGEDIMNKDEIIGNKVKIKNTKSKIGYPKRSAELNLLYSSGFNPDAEFIDFFISLGIIEKKGGWYSNEEWGLKVQGQDKLLPWLYEHPDKFEESKKTVNEMFSSYSTLDASETDIEDEGAESSAEDS